MDVTDVRLCTGVFDRITVNTVISRMIIGPDGNGDKISDDDSENTQFKISWPNDRRDIGATIWYRTPISASGTS
jgi:hypothetical protein